jgi:hypothetical protein
MNPETKLVENNVVTTTTIDLPSFIAKQQQALNIITEQITVLTTRQAQVIAELQALITPTPEPIPNPTEETLQDNSMPV